MAFFNLIKNYSNYFEGSCIFTKISEFLEERGLSQEFSLAVMDELEGISEKIPDSEISRRKDLMDMTIVTIDGADAKDLDDAVSVERLENASYKLGVHIADVSYYVKPGSAIDDEAFQRGTSVYLVDTVVPMLPQKLSNGLCSLNPHKPRLTMSIFMVVNSIGTVTSYEICESVIKTTARMTYSKVTQVLDGTMAARHEHHDLIPTFEVMRELALILRDKRMRRGSIDFDFPEPKIITDEAGKVIDIHNHEITISNKIIEEFMLLANETIAKHMNKLELPLVYRVHEKPDATKIEKLVVLVKSMGHKFKTKEDISPKVMQNLLFKIQDTPEQLILSTMMLRSLMKARYSEENLGHFGLAADYYCHFTSPIRRYPDLMVHRLLREWLNGNLVGNTIKMYEKITHDTSLQSSDTEVQATIAERDWVDYMMCSYMAERIGEEFDGVISSITSFGMFVQLPNTVEGLVRMVDLADDYYEFDDVHFILTGRRTGRQYHMGEMIRVRLSKVNVDLKQIDFIPVEAEAKGDKGKKEVKKHYDRKPKTKGKHRTKSNKKNGRSK